MYPYIYPTGEMIPACCWCMMNSMTGSQAMVPTESEPMMRYGEEFEEEFEEESRMENPSYAGQQMPGMGQQAPGAGQQVPVTDQQMSGMGHQGSGMMDMSKMDTGKTNVQVQEIVRMLEQHHSDMVQALTRAGMSIGQARQYLSRVVEMALMHHMMHQM